MGSARYTIFNAAKEATYGTGDLILDLAKDAAFLAYLLAPFHLLRKLFSRKTSILFCQKGFDVSNVPPSTAKLSTDLVKDLGKNLGVRCDVAQICIVSLTFTDATGLGLICRFSRRFRLFFCHRFRRSGSLGLFLRFLTTAQTFPLVIRTRSLGGRSLFRRLGSLNLFFVCICSSFGLGFRIDTHGRCVLISGLFSLGFLILIQTRVVVRFCRDIFSSKMQESIQKSALLLGVLGCLINFCIRSSFSRSRTSLFANSRIGSSSLCSTTAEQSLPRLRSTGHAAIPVLLAAFSAFILPFTVFLSVVLFRGLTIDRPGECKLKNLKRSRQNIADHAANGIEQPVDKTTQLINDVFFEEVPERFTDILLEYFIQRVFDRCSNVFEEPIDRSTSSAESVVQRFHTANKRTFHILLKPAGNVLAHLVNLLCRRIHDLVTCEIEDTAEQSALAFLLFGGNGLAVFIGRSLFHFNLITKQRLLNVRTKGSAKGRTQCRKGRTEYGSQTTGNDANASAKTKDQFGQSKTTKGTAATNFHKLGDLVPHVLADRTRIRIVFGTKERFLHHIRTGDHTAHGTDQTADHGTYRKRKKSASDSTQCKPASYFREVLFETSNNLRRDTRTFAFFIDRIPIAVVLEIPILIPLLLTEQEILETLRRTKQTQASTKERCNQRTTGQCHTGKKTKPSVQCRHTSCTDEHIGSSLVQFTENEVALLLGIVDVVFPLFAEHQFRERVYAPFDLTE